MAITFRITYETVTPESAQDGDVADRGYVWPHGGTDPSEPYEYSLREALDYVCPQENAGRWLSESDERINYQTGESEQRSLHPPANITRASYRRLCRLFKLKVS